MEELFELGLTCEPGITNDFIKRRESVAFWLTRLSGAGPAFQLNPSCKVLRKGFVGGYRYERLRATGPTRFKDRPVKDKYSHIHDALQYGAMELRGDVNPVTARQVVAGATRRWVGA